MASAQTHIGNVNFSWSATIGPELEVGEGSRDRELTLFLAIASVSNEPVITLAGQSAANSESHACCNVISQLVQVVPTVTFHDHLLISLRKSGSVCNKVTFEIFIVESHIICLIGVDVVFVTSSIASCVLPIRYLRDT